MICFEHYEAWNTTHKKNLALEESIAFKCAYNIKDGVEKRDKPAVLWKGLKHLDGQLYRDPQ